MKSQFRHSADDETPDSRRIAVSRSTAPQLENPTDRGVAIGHDDNKPNEPTRFNSAVQFVADAWPELPVHVKEAILTMIDLVRRSGKGSHNS